MAGVKTCSAQAARDGFTDPRVKESLYKLAFQGVACGILGARLFYAATHWQDFQNDWIGILKIWEGGLVFYGGLLGASGGFYVWNRSKAISASWTQVLDWASPSLAFGHAIGRLGCFAAGCCFGKPTNVPWGVTFTHPESLAPLGLPLHPTQIYESGFLVILGIFLLWRLSRARENFLSRTPGEGFLTL